jgi:uncharacterized protein (DUF1697 family)
MARYALLLRGVNIGTKNSLPMAELRKMLDEIGCTGARTLLQSGNAVLSTRLGPAELTRRISATLEAYMGRPVATTLRTLDQLSGIVDGHPFREVATNNSNMCVTFLSHAPTSAEVAPLHATDFSPELFQVAGTAIYTWHPRGQAESALRVALGKLRLRGSVTTRNWNTVLKLLEMLRES